MEEEAVKRGMRKEWDGDRQKGQDRYFMRVCL